ncbi:extracellular calcium-sensing receptor-like [Callorhinchus milii]|uniref:extracellular calcium-sensing receptor-like n=1 Tax=Callorhinchus milii TaxID=7868 RepID=UPI001C3FA361|nr:extracellular calcium-sensing receptor-like [Callorhinchus milii]
MIFTIEEINRNPALLPNTTLGYRVMDSCDTSSEALKCTLQFLNQDEEKAPLGHQCDRSPSVPLIIGDAGSSHSAAVSRIVGLFGIPLVSYFATCACLSDKREFPTFLRTVPSDAVQVKALVSLVQRFQWTWVGVVAADSDYGQFGIQSFIEEVTNSNVCIAYIEFIPPVRTRDMIQQIVNTIGTSSARVMVLFCGESDTLVVIEGLKEQNITDIQLIASEAWVTSSLLWTEETQELLSGTIGFGIRKAEIPGLREFLVKLHPSTAPDNPFVRELWQEVFGCELETRIGLLEQNTSLSPYGPCTGLENLETIENIYTDVSQLRVSYNVYKAVYAAAYALHNLLSCELEKDPFTDNTCGQKFTILPWQLLHYLKEVRFTNGFGEDIAFDDYGDPIASYDLINWQRTANGSVDFVKVGYYDAALLPGEELVLDESTIYWNGRQNNVPISVCSLSCPPGSRKAARKDQPICCFDCIVCADGEVSNQTDSVECLRCSVHHWSNDRRTECILKDTEYLSFQDTMGITLTVISLSGACITVTVACVFLYFIKTPIVKANNSELSFLLLTSLILCFLCAIAFIGQPTAWSCMVCHTVFGISFVLCISCILGKTLVVLMAFRATLPGSNVMKWFGATQQRSIVFITTLIQMILCIIWLTTSPPFPAKNFKYHKAKIILECDVGSTVAFCCVLGYIGLLAGTCFILAFLARKLPDQFNEAKYITFSILIFFTVWVTFIPAYVSTPGKYTVAVEIFAILASSFGLLFCIFVPKCYIILLKPEHNTKKHLMGKPVINRR